MLIPLFQLLPCTNTAKSVMLHHPYETITPRPLAVPVGAKQPIQVAYITVMTQSLPHHGEEHVLCAQAPIQANVQSQKQNL